MKISMLRRDGWVIVRKKGNQLRLHKRTNTEVLKLTIPTHRPIKKSTLHHILKNARFSLEHLDISL
jgi:predicted RNA binding protein YcfA (HicA-like mRNA interferase family)